MPERRLNTSQDLRRYLANLIRRTESKEIELSLAKSLAYMSSVLLRVIEGSDLERRISELEKKLKQGAIDELGK